MDTAAQLQCRSARGIHLLLHRVRIRRRGRRTAPLCALSIKAVTAFKHLATLQHNKHLWLINKALVVVGGSQVPRAIATLSALLPLAWAGNLHIPLQVVLAGRASGIVLVSYTPL